MCLIALAVVEAGASGSRVARPSTLPSMDESVEPRVFRNVWADVVPAGEPLSSCTCFEQLPGTSPVSGAVRFHPEQQDTASPGWQHLLELIDQAANDHREEFRPLTELTEIERSQVITLPSDISRLTAVRHLQLYGSHLVRLPPEVGAMRSLEKLTVYTSYRLHWFPYELTRCANLAESTVSTRALYGNFKFRPPFPALDAPVSTDRPTALSGLDPGTWGTTSAHECSVCAQTVTDEVHQVWISLVVATDVLPLLVNACSDACIQALPIPPGGYIPGPHRGGSVRQPPLAYL